MRRSALNLVVDLVSLLALLCVAVTGLLLRWVLPPGSRGGSGLSLWGWTRHDWGDLHFYLVTALGGLLVVHLALHWAWVCMILRSLFVRAENRTRPPRHLARNLYGLVTVMALAGAVSLFLWYASNAVSQKPRGEQGGHRYGARQATEEARPEADDAGRENGLGGGRRIRGNR